MKGANTLVKVKTFHRRLVKNETFFSPQWTQPEVGTSR